MRESNTDLHQPPASSPPSTNSAPFADLAQLSETLGATASRLERIRLVAQCLRDLNADDAEIAARLLLGRTSPETQGRRLSLGGRAVWEAAVAAGADSDADRHSTAVDFGEVIAQAMPARNVAKPLTLDDVQRGFEAIASIAGAGARARRLQELTDLLRRATPTEAKMLAKIVIGEMRHGVQEGILLDAAATLAGLTAAEVRRLQQSLGDIGNLIRRVKTDIGGLRAIGVELGRAIKPMLAQAAADVAEAMTRLEGRLALEFKLDGARVQIHCMGHDVRIFSRRLQDITRSLPDVVEDVKRLAAMKLGVFEGEVIAVENSRPLPFQELMRRFRRVRDIEAAAREIPVRLFLFDLLHDGERVLFDDTYEARWSALQRARGDLESVPRSLPESIDEARAFFRAALDAGHEGVMAKALDSTYTPGIRGSGWLKIKHSVTLDLVIVAADWGYGRRHGWLSNYHLAARDPSTNGWAEVGKTFKGPTDAEFRAMTERLLAIRVSEMHGTVRVRPEIVVEVRFDGIQKSSHYACGIALRFARIVRVRDDKSADEADTVDTLRRLFEGESRPA